MLLDIHVPAEDSTSESDTSEESDDEPIDSPHQNEDSYDEAPVLSPLSDLSFSSDLSSDDDLNQQSLSITTEDEAGTHDEGTEPSENKPEHFSFIIVGDNLDRTVRPRYSWLFALIYLIFVRFQPLHGQVISVFISALHLKISYLICAFSCRYMRSDHFQNRSLHYFNSFAVKDRIPLSQLMVYNPAAQSQSCHIAESILPSVADDVAITKGLSTLVSRILTKNVPFFNMSFSDVIDWHMPHQFSEEMSKPSEVVRTLEQHKQCLVIRTAIFTFNRFP